MLSRFFQSRTSNDHEDHPQKNDDENTALLTVGESSAPIISDQLQNNNNNSDDDHNDDHVEEYNSTNGRTVHYEDHDDDNQDENDDASNEDKQLQPPELLPIWTITCILSTAFAYGCVMTTLFLITLPVECDRIEQQHPTIPKSVRQK